jgi:membrane protein required for colicin V production
MPIIDILIAIVLTISVVIGVVRGFVKEAISITALLLAIWAALTFGPSVGEISDSWISSKDLQTWFGRILVFTLILALGGLLGWGISKLVRLSVLSGIDRLVGGFFGAARGILFVAVFILAGEYASFGNDSWWKKSRLIPHFQVVAEWIMVMAPQGYEMLVPDGPTKSLPIELD